MTLLVQGTDLYAIDPDDGTLLSVDCITSIDGVDSTIGVTTISCINTGSDSKQPGNTTPGKMTFGVNLDPSNEQHVRLLALKKKKAVLNWAIGLGDGPRDANNVSTAAPTVDSDDDFHLPTTRSFITLQGFMTNFPVSFANAGAVVSSSISVEMSSDYVLVPKA